MKRNFSSFKFSLTICYAVLPATIADAQKIYWTDRGSSKIQRANLDGTDVEDLLVTSVYEPVSIALDVARGKMYWTEASPADFMISRANLDGTNLEFLVTGLFEPSGIALDTIAGKVYWTDVGTGKISRMNVDFGGGEDIVDDPSLDAIEIALDVPAGKLYWTGSTPSGSKIFRANLDGTNMQVLVTSLLSASGIALDTSRGKMYWTDRGASKIQRANLDGSQVEDFITTGLIEPVRITLDLVARQIYWTEASPADFMIFRANLDAPGGEALVTGLSSPSGIALDVAAGPAIPATSSWGLAAMAIALATAATLTLRRSAKDRIVHAIS